MRISLLSSKKSTPCYQGRVVQKPSRWISKPGHTARATEPCRETPNSGDGIESACGRSRGNSIYRGEWLADRARNLVVKVPSIVDRRDLVGR